jgi:MerR family copper efflux transcriptional regulator
MGRQGLRVGEVVARSGVSRKALRLYEAMGILPPPARTETGYRLYGDDVLAVLRFVTQARRLGFSLAEIRDIAAIRRSGQLPCPHVQNLVRQRVAAVEDTLRELTATRQTLRAMLASWRARSGRGATVCPHIEEGR